MPLYSDFRAIRWARSVARSYYHHSKFTKFQNVVNIHISLRSSLAMRLRYWKGVHPEFLTRLRPEPEND